MKTGQLLQSQTAIVTGASSGIGEGIAKALAAAGAMVVVNYSKASTESDASAIISDIVNKGGKAIPYQCDVSKEEEVLQMFKDVVQQLGTVDILVNNAGLQRDAPLTEMTLQQWNEVIGVNLTGQFLCAREAAKEFLRRGMKPDISVALGKIICISSVHQVIPWGGHVNYASSKGGINMMMQTMAQELAPKKIRVNSIGPGAIKTPINKSAWGTPDGEKKLLELIPYGRIGTIEDVGKAAVWLASDESDYITGATMFIDGGMTLYPGFSDNG